MHYMVYVICNPSRTIFFLGVTGGFTDGIFDFDIIPQRGISLWQNCTMLVHHKRFRDLGEAADYIELLQEDVNRWAFPEIENRNRRWRDLSDQWLDPTRLLSFQVIRNSFYCCVN